ncbi:Ca2+/H+ antiporter, TMEM165/GDT1 family, partial [Tremellales sp. Uapishka_1]
MADMEAAEGNANALFKAFTLIVVSEIGDKTFLIAAIMATRHPRITVFGGAFASLVIMSILSAALGRVILGLIPKVWTQWAAALLFVIFGVKLLQEALAMSSGNAHIQEEMREVEEELEEDSTTHHGSVPLESMEEGRIPSSPGTSRFGGTTKARSSSPKPNKPSISFPLSGVGPTSRKNKDWVSTLKASSRNLLQLLTNPVFAQAFVLTFLGEWGDRSQIATIALGGAHSIPVIAFGTILGHGLCTLGAVMGGRYISTKISIKHISLIGACAFLVFGFLYALEAWNSVGEPNEYS